MFFKALIFIYMNFLDPKGKNLDHFTHNFTKASNKAIDFLFKRKLKIYLSLGFLFVIFISVILLAKPLNFISQVEGKIFPSKSVVAANIYVITNNSISNLDKIAGVNLQNSNLHTSVLAAVIPNYSEYEVSAQVSTQTHSFPNFNTLYNFLVSRDSPLAPYTGDILQASSQYGIDWRLLVGISGVESGFGRVIPEDVYGNLSYNAWGWTGGSNGQFGAFAGFSSWPDAIYTVAKGISYAYGNESPYYMEGAYDPGNPAWAPNVENYMSQL